MCNPYPNRKSRFGFRGTCMLQLFLNEHQCIHPSHISVFSVSGYKVGSQIRSLSIGFGFGLLSVMSSCKKYRPSCTTNGIQHKLHLCFKPNIQFTQQFQTGADCGNTRGEPSVYQYISIYYICLYKANSISFCSCIFLYKNNFSKLFF